MGFPRQKCQMKLESGVVENGYFSAFGRYIFAVFRDKAAIILCGIGFPLTRKYTAVSQNGSSLPSLITMTLCQPLPTIFGRHVPGTIQEICNKRMCN